MGSDVYAECGKPTEGGPCRMPAPHSGAHIPIRLRSMPMPLAPSPAEAYFPKRIAPEHVARLKEILRETAARLDLTEQEPRP